MVEMRSDYELLWFTIFDRQERAYHYYSSGYADKYIQVDQFPPLGKENNIGISCLEVRACCQLHE
jgi:hypothetical protein